MVFALTVICVTTAAILAATNALTADRIAYNLEQSLNNSFVLIFGEGATAKKLDETPDGAEAVYEISYEGDTYYCANVITKGFGGEISLLAAFDTGGKIAGARVVSHTETPGIGSILEDDDFLSLFKGKSDAGAVDSVSGATISSTAFKNGVAKAQSILAAAGLIGGTQ